MKPHKAVPHEALPVLLAHAFRLLDLRLVDREADDARSQAAVAHCVAAHPPGCDLIVAEDATKQAFKEATQYDGAAVPTELASLLLLAKHVIRLELGCPVVRDPIVGRAVLRIVDPESLVAACLARNYPLDAARDGAEALLGWPPLLPGARSEVDGVMGKPIADLHLHLAGALPPAFNWIFVLAGLTVSVKEFDTSAWRKAWEEARKALLDIAVELGHPRGDLLTLLATLTPVDPEHVQAHERDWPLGHAPAVVKNAKGLVLAALAGERRLLVKALAAATSPHADTLCSRLVDYLKVKNAFHYFSTYSGGVRGLARFRRTMARRRILNDPNTARIERWRMGCAVENVVRSIVPHLDRTRGGTAPPLDLEVRVSLARGPDFITRLRGWFAGIRNVLALWPQLPLRVGLVIHHLRSDGDEKLLRSISMETSAALIGLLGENPNLRPLIVGLDAAGDELAAPPRTSAPSYRRARDLLDVEIPGRHPDGPPCRLGFTYHVGEDFRDILTGLRHIDEAAHVLGMKHQDRIGHGLALFMKPVDFYLRRPQTYPTARDLALDLLWCWSVLRDRPDLAERARRALSDHLGLNKSSGDMDGHAKDLDADGRRVNLALKDDHVDVGGRRANGSTEDDQVVLDEAKLYESIRGDEKLDGDQMIAVRADPSWIALVTAAQEVVVQRLLKRGLAVELNPTSNLVIGGFASYGDLPYLRVLTEGSLAARLPLVVGTDDPGLFHTSLRGEYDAIAAGLVELGCTSEALRGHLERLRQTSVERSFIPPWAPRGQDLRDHIDDLIGPALG